jgi:riboflavin kinase / FMN adenylyltransferase
VPRTAPGNLDHVNVVFGPERCHPPEHGSAVTIGAYDGVHLGHRHLLAELRRRADERGLATAVVTFDRHPATVVRPESAPLLLTDLDQKLELLGDVGVDLTVVVPFDEVRAHETPEDFVREVLVEALGARLVVVGEDFHFGYQRKGNVELLSELGAMYGYDVVGVALEHAGSDAVSSTRIRALLAAGDVQGAAALLGRYHQVRGTVVRGDGRGGPELGFPTANLEFPAGLAVPGVGIYAGWYERPGGEVHAAAVSVGRRPTFHPEADAPPLLEAFLLDFEGDLYGQAARVSFVARLRDEQAFDTVGALVRQMADDVEAARAVLATSPR